MIQGRGHGGQIFLVGDVMTMCEAQKAEAGKQNTRKSRSGC
jgi:hypothetical protein